jgi:Tfp pilus assembly major pilin PilA
MKTRTLIAIATLALTGAAFAQTAPTAPNTPKDPLATPRIDKREANQQKRIDAGVASGQITSTEAGKLQTRETRTATAEANAKADGKVTTKERARLNRKENQDSRAIRRAKHNNKVATPAS